jgi:hypothetical protein
MKFSRSDFEMQRFESRRPSQRVRSLRDTLVEHRIDLAAAKRLQAPNFGGPAASAIKARDRAKFPAAYDKLTAACNSRHQGSNRGFIVVQRPPASAFPNQSFAPKRK